MDSGYTPGTPPAAGGPVSGDDGSDYTGGDIEKRRREFMSYLGSKSAEIDEQKEARRYYHTSQWTAKAIREFKRRKQPIVTYNREAPKINGIVGLLERLRQDPKGFDRTPQPSQPGPDGEPEMSGAEIATATLRYILDNQRWKEKSPDSALKGAIDGIGGMEVVIEQGDQGDPDIGLEVVDPSGFFYDPRSLKADFSDARFMGIGKWVDIDLVIEMWPDKKEEIRASIDAGTDLSSNPDSDNKWIMGDERSRRLRLIDHWYMKGDQWFWCIYIGTLDLDSGPSYLVDEKGKTFCKYIMFSANVDQDGDRYGFHRNFKSPQDEVNQRRSKGLHIANSRRMILQKGSVDDPEKTRNEAARPDGVIVWNPGTAAPEFDDAVRAQEMAAQLEFLAEAKAEIDSYGPTQELMGEGSSDMSGRAIQLRQQAGIAQLGPYLLSYKGWKLRLYRALWNAAQGHWTAERWIRVTDDEGLAKFFAVNQQAKDQFGNPMVDPATGEAQLIHHLGSLDVDIIIDEGSDQVTMQADQYETAQTLATSGEPVPPQVLIELSPLDPRVKAKVMGMIEQSQNSPIKQIGMQTQIEGQKAKTAESASKAQLNQAKAMKEMQPAAGVPDQGAQLAFDKWHALLISFTDIIIAQINTGQAMDEAALTAKIDAFLGVSGLANDQQMQLRDHAHQRVMLAMQPPPQPPASSAPPAQ